MRLAGTHPMNLNLQMVAIHVDQSAHKHDVVFVKSVYRIFKPIPPLAGNVSGSVGKREHCKLAASFFGAQFFGFDQKRGADVLIGCEIADEDFFHTSPVG